MFVILIVPMMLRAHVSQSSPLREVVGDGRTLAMLSFTKCTSTNNSILSARVSQVYANYIVKKDAAVSFPEHTD